MNESSESLRAAGKLLEGFHVLLPLTIQWGDQDAFGHVNNTIFLRWFESGRIAYMRQVGFSDDPGEGDVGLILASITCNFRRQVSFPDTVLIGSRVTRIGRSSMTMEHAVASGAQSQIVADGVSAVVAFDYHANSSIAVPNSLRETISQLEGQEFQPPE